MKISRDYLKKPKRDPHLHSPTHVLADELSRKLDDAKHFGFYLKTAMTVDHNVLRKIAGDVLEKSHQNPGALFAFLVKKYNREKNVTRGCSVWLLPEPEMRKRFDRLIVNLAASYNSVPFPAHITLLADLPLEQSAEPLNRVTEVKFLSANLGPIQTEESFFKSLYLPVEKNKELASLRRKVKKILDSESKHKFDPHLSLLYGNYKPEQKPEMIRRLTTPFPEQITFSEVALVKTDGTPDAWQIIKSIQLQPE